MTAKHLIQRDITLLKVNKQHDQLHQNLSNARMCLLLLSFCDQSWRFEIKVSYFSGPSQVRKWSPSASKSVLGLNE